MNNRREPLPRTVVLEPYRPPASDHDDGCECSVPVRDRLYIGTWNCRLCAKLIVRERGT